MSTPISSNINSLSNPNDRLKEIVHLVLNSWPSYQFAIKNQLGGSQTRAKDEWFGEVLCDYLFKHTNLYNDELSEWIADILYTEFDTICEDGTLEPTAKLLIQMSNWLLGRGKDGAEVARQKIEENMQKLKQTLNKQAIITSPQQIEGSSTSEDEDSNEEEGRCLNSKQ